MTRDCIKKIGLLITRICPLFLVGSILMGDFSGAASTADMNEPLGWTASSLRIPAKSAPWKFMHEVEGNYVMLDIPQDLPLLDRYPPQLRKSIEKHIGFRNANIDLFTSLAVSTERLVRHHRFRRVPQYERLLNTAVIAIDPSQENNGDMLYRYEPIIMNLPVHTQLHVFVPEEKAAAVRKRMKILWHDRQYTIHSVASWRDSDNEVELPPYPVSWAQDIFRVAFDESGKQYLFTPMCYLQSDNLCRWDIDYLKALSSKEHLREVVRLPIFFRAGNILIGETTQQQLLFVGKKVLKFNSRNYFNAAHFQPSDEAVLGLLKATSGADQVIVLPNSTNLFHLDMAVTFLEQGTAAIVDPLDRGNVSQEDRQVLAEITKILGDHGIRIVRVPTTAKRIKAYQSPVNAVIYVNREDGQRTVLLPEYADAIVYLKGEKHSLNRMIRDAYAAAGLTVIPIEDRFHLGAGDIHCAFKVID